MTNSPYATPTTLDPAELKAWTDANVRARREYELHQITACSVTDCWRLVTAPCGNLCASHGRNGA